MSERSVIVVSEFGVKGENLGEKQLKCLLAAGYIQAPYQSVFRGLLEPQVQDSTLKEPNQKSGHGVTEEA